MRGSDRLKKREKIIGHQMLPGTVSSHLHLMMKTLFGIIKLHVMNIRQMIGPQ
jgi:hypothetical protein